MSEGDDYPKVSTWHRNRDEFLPVLKAAEAYRDAHESAYPGHLVWIDRRGGIDFQMACFKCLDEIKRINRANVL